VEVIQLNKNNLYNHISTLSSFSCKLLIYLACISNVENEIEIKIQSVLNALGVKKPTFSSAIKELKELGIINILFYDGRSYKLRIALNDSDIESHIKTYIQEKLF